MKIVVLSDYLGRSEYLEKLTLVVEDIDPDMIVFAGGICRERTGINGEEMVKCCSDEINEFLDHIISLGKQCLIIPGGSDVPTKTYDDIMLERGKHPLIRHIHLRYVQIDGVLFCGCGGVIDGEGLQYQITKSTVYDKMINLKAFKQEKILLLHTPFEIKSVHDDVGSKTVNDLIEQLDPKMVFYAKDPEGHKMRLVGDCVAVCPGDMASGRYCVVNTKTMNVQFKNMEDL